MTESVIVWTVALTIGAALPIALFLLALNGMIGFHCCFIYLLFLGILTGFKSC